MEASIILLAFYFYSLLATFAFLTELFLQIGAQCEQRNVTHECEFLFLTRLSEGFLSVLVYAQCMERVAEDHWILECSMAQRVNQLHPLLVIKGIA